MHGKGVEEEEVVTSRKMTGQASRDPLARYTLCAYKTFGDPVFASTQITAIRNLYTTVPFLVTGRENKHQEPTMECGRIRTVRPPKPFWGTGYLIT